MQMSEKPKIQLMLAVNEPLLYFGKVRPDPRFSFRNDTVATMSVSELISCKNVGRYTTSIPLLSTNERSQKSV